MSRGRDSSPEEGASPSELSEATLIYSEQAPSDERLIDAIVERVVHAASLAVGVDADLSDLPIVLQEALANAVQHGNRGQLGKSVGVRCYAEGPDTLCLAVWDEGDGFDPDAIPDPTADHRLHLDHGRGVFLMRQLMDRLEHRRGGREVWMWKRVSPPAPTEPSAPDAAEPSPGRES